MVYCLPYFNPHEREARDVKLYHNGGPAGILIHTSVKLVTRRQRIPPPILRHFNPHEREARDLVQAIRGAEGDNFNPHEREARDRS